MFRNLLISIVVTALGITGYHWLVIQKPPKALDIKTLVDSEMTVLAKKLQDGKNVSGKDIQNFLDRMNSYLDNQYPDDVIYSKGAVVKGAEDITQSVAEHLGVQLLQTQKNERK